MGIQEFVQIIKSKRFLMTAEQLEIIERRLGYIFSNKKLLVRALTRKAYAQEQRQQGRICEDQEVYRILGDALLKVLLVELLIEKGYASREAITNQKIALENRESLGLIFQELKITEYVYFGAGERKQQISTQRAVLGEVFEALIAAIHLDCGCYENTKRVIKHLFQVKIAPAKK